MIHYRIILIVFLILINGTSFAQSHQRLENRGKLKFINKVHDFGTVFNDTILNAKYTFTNIGTKAVRIEFVKPDCTCTNYELSQKELAPGDTAYIRLNFNTENKYGPQTIYSVVKANTIEKMYKLTIKVNIDVPLD